MKKLIAVLLTLLLTMSMFSVVSFAAVSAGEANVYVSISASKDSLQLAYYSVKVTDIDSDGVLTINDALYCAHEDAYTGGAASGYKAVFSQWGLSLAKLWGIENGGSYGYYVNNASAWSLADPVKEGDHVYAFVYSDTKFFSDEYAFFTENVKTVKQGEEIKLSLKKLGYNEMWELTEAPAANAVITVDGKATDVKTDSEGNAVITITKSGTHTISALSPEGEIITAPVCKVTVNSDLGSLIMYYIRLIINALLALIGR